MKRLLHLLPTLLLVAACARPTDNALPAPVAGSALYRVTFQATWNAAAYADFPAGAHFSPLIGLSHRADALVFRPGELASLGIQNVAELGRNAALRTEINALRDRNAALSLLDGRGSTPSPGSLTDTIRLDAQHPRLTVVTMLAPSPDWFAALENELLLTANGQWVAQRTVPARAYDAGTDSGLTFTAPDQPTLPAERIAPLRLPPATGPAPDGPPVGMWLVERIR